MSLLSFYSLLLVFVPVTKSTTIYVNHNSTDTPKCLLSELTSCRSLDYVASNVRDKHNVSIVVTSPVITVQSVITFDNVNGITVRSYNKTIVKCVSNYTEGGAGLQFSNSSDIVLENFSFINCSGIYDKPDYFFFFGIFISSTRNLLITNVTIRGSYGYGLVLLNILNNITISKSSFVANTYKNSIIHSGGLIIINNLLNESSVWQITGVNFTGNRGYDFSSLSNFSQGGGLHISNSNSKNIVINIRNVFFSDNSATFGGGLFILNCEDSTNNTVIVDNCTFFQNKADRGGGGSNVGFERLHDSIPQNNSVYFSNCSWDQNLSSDFGGGLSVFTDFIDTYRHVVNNHLSFVGCNFTGNRGNDGSAIKLAPILRSGTGRDVLVKVNFTNCNFENNLAMADREIEGEYTHGSTVLVFEIWVYISGINVFQNNVGTGILLSSATAVFNNSNNTFNDNTAEKGAGIRLLTYSFIEVHETNNFFFTNNKAIYGAGITSEHVHSLEFLFMDNCFVKGLANSSNYFFENNTATSTYGHDLFIYTLHPCIEKFILQISKNPTNYSTYISELFKRNIIGNFIFENDTNFLNESVTTTPDSLQTNNCKCVHAVPGREMKIDIIQLDQLNHTTDIFFLFLRFNNPNSHGGITLKSKMIAPSNPVLTLFGKPGASSVLIIESELKTTPPLAINVIMVNCYPGFVFTNDSCKCSDDNQSTALTGIIRCNNGKYALLSVGNWAGYVDKNSNSVFVIGGCPSFFCSFNKQQVFMGSLKLSNNKTQLENDVCANNRRGTLCSECTNGTSVYYNSPSYSCWPDKHCEAGPILFFLVEIIPITVLFLFILFLNINLTSGAVYTLIFYVQILDAFSIDAFGILRFSKGIKNVLNICRVLYGVANMRFFVLEKLSFCIWKGAKTLDVISLKYAVTLYAILLIGLTIAILKVYSLYFCIKICKKYGRKNIRYSVVNSLSAFIVVCYFHLIHTSFSSFVCVRIKTYGDVTKKFVALFDGNIVCESHDHLKYMTPAMICLLLIALPPLILVLEPILVKLIGRFEHRVYCCFYLNKLRTLLVPFLDSFQGCFKNNCRIFAGFFFVYRIVLAEFLVLSPSIHKQYICSILVIVIIITIHALTSPFAKKWHNKFDLFLLVNLLTIVIFAYINITINPTGKQNLISDLIAIAQLMLCSTPFVFFIVYSGWYIFKKYKHKFLNKMSDEDQMDAVSQEIVFAKIDSIGKYQSVSYSLNTNALVM